MKQHYKSVLTIAGSDSGGGAGIQADIKTISANGAYAASVITASTAQNTQGIIDIHPIPVEHIVKQLEALLDDIEFGAIKIGMLHSSEVINAIEKTLKHYGTHKIVLDPVMIATSGKRLLTNEAVEALKKFLPNTYLITPNISEAEVLIGMSITFENLEESVKKLGELYQVSVLLKGGHLKFIDEMTDTLYIYESKKVVFIRNRAIESDNRHGTGCSLSSAIATFLTLGDDLETATFKGCHYVNRAIEGGRDKILGRGNGPINHFYDIKFN